MDISGNGSRHLGRRGFSLIELLLVLMLLGIIAGVAAPATGRFLDSLRFREQTAELLAAIRYARLMAVGRGRPVHLHFVPEEKALFFNGAVTERKPLTLAENGEVVFTPEILTFYPDGLATPARLVARSGRRSAEFVVDPLTGIPAREE
ncbi:pilus assembly FimT family protein [Thiovibrio sp. JS02]